MERVGLLHHRIDYPRERAYESFSETSTTEIFEALKKSEVKMQRTTTTMVMSLVIY
jgi:hypothetical protein